MSHVVSGALGFVKDWNFAVPVVLWGWHELARWLLRRRRRSHLWGFRRGRSVVVVREQPSRYQGYLFGEVGPLAVATAGQRVVDELRKSGLHVVQSAVRDFDPNSAGNMAIVSLLGDDRSTAGTMAQQLGVRLSTKGNTIHLGDHVIRPQLRLVEGTLRMDSDYGVLIRGRNPHDGRHGVTIIAALTAQAVEGVVKTLSSEFRTGPRARRGMTTVQLFTFDMRSGIVRIQEIIQRGGD